MVLPNFLIVGAQKSGTTTLHDILQQHPEANMSNVKEINFFTSTDKLKRGLSYYSSFFAENGLNHKIVGESTPGYMCYPGVAKLVKQSLGNVKIVMILRNPIARAFSQYWDNRRHLSEHLTMEQIIGRYLTDIYDPRSKGYFSRGVYFKFVEEYLRYFGRENLHVIILEEFIERPEFELKKLFQFLCIDDSERFLKLNTISNSSMVWDNALYRFFLDHPQLIRFVPKHARRLFFWGGRRKFKYPLPEKRKLKVLSDFYSSWNSELGKFLGKDLSRWNAELF